MHRRDLLEKLDSYLSRYPEEEDMVGRLRAFVLRRADCFKRSCLEGHVTASAWVVSVDGGSVLLTHHRKLGIWLQLGGHTDGQSETGAAALREAREESGLRSLWLSEVGGAAEPLDVDIHEIPARPGEPAHLHYDIRYLLRADGAEEPIVSEESTDVRWVEISDVESYSTEASVVRMLRKAERLEVVSAS